MDIGGKLVFKPPYYNYNPGAYFKIDNDGNFQVINGDQYLMLDKDIISYNFSEDDAHDIVWNSKSIWGGSYGIPKKDVPTFEDENKLNHLMEQCFIHCDPCEILIDLDEKTNP